MVSKNKFGFDPLETKAVAPKRERAPGPMGAAVREAAESLSEATEAKVEQRRQNAADAKEYRAAQVEGRVLMTLPLAEVHTDDLPRDRLELENVAASVEMEELKSSIVARGQKEPVEVYEGEDGRYQLKKGWRRFTALSQLSEETGEAQYGEIIARLAAPGEVRISRYIDMVEENVVREDLSFAEMAQVAIVAAGDGEIGESDPEALVLRLYGNLHKMKRSYIRAFVQLLVACGDCLQWPKDVARNLGVDVVRQIKSGEVDVEALRDALARCNSREEQAGVLGAFAKPAKVVGEARAPREKFEFHVEGLKVTARKGECRIVGAVDYTEVPRDQLEAAVRAFEAALRGR